MGKAIRRQGSGRRDPRHLRPRDETAGTGCFRTIVVEEGCYDRTEASHAMALFDMDQKYADVRGVEEVSSWLTSTFAGRSTAATG